MKITLTFETREDLVKFMTIAVDVIEVTQQPGLLMIKDRKDGTMDLHTRELTLVIQPTDMEIMTWWKPKKAINGSYGIKPVETGNYVILVEKTPQQLPGICAVVHTSNGPVITHTRHVDGPTDVVSEYGPFQSMDELRGFAKRRGLRME